MQNPAEPLGSEKMGETKVCGQESWKWTRAQVGFRLRAYLFLLPVEFTSRDGGQPKWHPHVNPKPCCTLTLQVLLNEDVPTLAQQNCPFPMRTIYTFPGAEPIMWCPG